MIAGVKKSFKSSVEGEVWGTDGRWGERKEEEEENDKILEKQKEKEETKEKEVKERKKKDFSTK